MTLRRQRTIASATLMLACVRIALWLMPFAVASRAFERLSRRASGPHAEPPTIAAIVAGVERASRWLPGGSHCLTKALAGQILLRRHGYPARVCYGVAAEPARPFRAHAWLESEGRVVIGGADAEASFVRLRP